jgi:hypothetical protein
VVEVVVVVVVEVVVVVVVVEVVVVVVVVVEVVVVVVEVVLVVVEEEEEESRRRRRRIRIIGFLMKLNPMSCHVIPSCKTSMTMKCEIGAPKNLVLTPQWQFVLPMTVPRR